MHLRPCTPPRPCIPNPAVRPCTVLDSCNPTLIPRTWTAPRFFTPRFCTPHFAPWNPAPQEPVIHPGPCTSDFIPSPDLLPPLNSESGTSGFYLGIPDHPLPQPEPGSHISLPPPYFLNMGTSHPWRFCWLQPPLNLVLGPFYFVLRSCSCSSLSWVLSGPWIP